MQKDFSQDPKMMLQTAIEELEVFTQTETSRLELGADGRLVAAKESRLERVVGLARCYIGPLFSDHVRQNQEKKLRELKKAILQARDIIQSHSSLIEKLKEGDEAQRKLADSALSAIKRYNAIVAQENFSKAMKSDVYNYERQRLLLDQEIKGQPIELPHTMTIQYNSHPDTAHSAHKMLKELSLTLRNETLKKSNQSLCSTHKKAIQFMIDTFHMKAIRMMQTHLQNPVSEIVPLIKQTTPEIDERDPDLIMMRQLIEVDAGSTILVSGCFKRNTRDPKFMTMPILDSFRLSFQLTHSGYPYSSQHTGWSLSTQWIEALPLRADQVPLFQRVYQRRKRLAHQLLFDQPFIQKVRRYFKIKQEVFDQNRDLFLPLHFQFQQLLQKEMLKEAPSILNAFFQEVSHAHSAFDLLAHTHQQMLDLFIKNSMEALEEEWLSLESTPLRIGTPQDKFQTVCLRFEQHRQKVIQLLDPAHPCHAYLLHQGNLLSQAFQGVGLQYQSEKIGFPPPFLNDLERKLQACAFQQLLTFLDECEHCLDILDQDQIKSNLLKALSTDLQLLDVNAKEEDFLPFAIVDELEVYFNSRFYSHSHPHEISFKTQH